MTKNTKIIILLLVIGFISKQIMLIGGIVWGTSVLLDRLKLTNKFGSTTAKWENRKRHAKRECAKRIKGNEIVVRKINSTKKKLIDVIYKEI